MWSAPDYQRIIPDASSVLTDLVVDWSFGRVWRTNFAAPGFAVLDLGPAIGPRGLRSAMIDLKERLGAVGRRRGGARFAFQSLGRYDQQVTTKFHLDGAPDRSLLMLGYEPSPVRSHLALADYSRCAHHLGITPRQFLDEFNPMYRRGEERLLPYVTLLPEPPAGFSRILLVNNSLLPFAEGRQDPLGVLHRAEIPEPDDSQRRVMNSIMLRVDDSETIDPDLLARFVADDAVIGPVFRAG